MDHELSFGEWEQCPSAMQPSSREEKRHGKRLATSSLSNLATTSSPTRPRSGGLDVVGESKIEGGEDAVEKKIKVDGDGVSNDQGNHIWNERERRKKLKDLFGNLNSLLPRSTPKTDKWSIVNDSITYIKSLEVTLHSLEQKKMERDRGVLGVAGSRYAFPAASSAMAQLPPKPKREACLADFGAGTGLFADSTNASMPSVQPQQGRSYPGVAIGGGVQSVYPTGNTLPPFQVAAPRRLQTWVSPNMVVSVCGLDAHISVCCDKKQGLLAQVLGVLEENGIRVVTMQVAAEGSGTMYMIHTRVNNVPFQFGADPFATVQDLYRIAAGQILDFLSFP